MSIKNFRCFDNSTHTINFNPGMNVLVGENDSGKSAIIDAIKIVLGTTDQSWYRIEHTDFHNENLNSEITISCKFSCLSSNEQASFLECLTYENDIPVLYLNWKCKCIKTFSSPRFATDISTGKEFDGPTPAAEARELLRSTYLRPLRDAYMNMQSGRGSRLSQVLCSVDNLNAGQDYSEDIRDINDLHSLSLTGIVNLSNDLLANNPQIKSVNEKISNTLSDKMLLSGDEIKTSISVAGTDISDEKKLNSLLEKLDLIANEKSTGRVGLGTSNILSMACELLLNHDDESSFLLIEEPEAHIHAQRQLRLIQSLVDSTITGSHQIIITTHSPLLASVIKLDNIIVVKKATAFSLSSKNTLLDISDYKFLERYLDATKANLFFAKGVMVVEGPSEELLLPTIARLIGKDLTKYGVSIVNARGIGLKRFAGIFKRKAEPYINDPVACVTDRDVMPDCAPAICIDEKYTDVTSYPSRSRRKWRTESEIEDKDAYLNSKCEKADGQSVKTYVSDHWTLEYDLAYAGLSDDILTAIACIKKQDELESIRLDKDNTEETIKEKQDSIISAFVTQEKTNLEKYDSVEEKCSYIYSFFSSISKPEVAQELSFLLEEKYSEKPDELKEKLPKYIVNAIEHVTEKD